MFKILLLLLLVLFSCHYPDIDTVPKFDSLVITEEEEIDKCKIRNLNNYFKENCYKVLKEIIDRL